MSSFRSWTQKPKWIQAFILTALLFVSYSALGYYPLKPAERPIFDGDVSILKLDLQSENLSTLINGKKTFLFYFLPTCPHCQEATPSIVALAKKYQGQIEFLGVASARSRLSEVREFQERFGVPFPIVQDAGSFGSHNNLRGYPAFMLTDGTASPVEVYNSYSKDMDIQLEVAIVRALGKNPLELLKPDTYYGSTVCASCHVEEYRSWGVNHHSVAMQSLFQINRHTDPKCVSCHVVAYGQKGGYVDLESSYHLANVGCESCHGPAGGHNKKESVEEKLARKKLSAVEQYGKVCVTCHDEAHSIAFKPEKGIPIVGHHFDRTLSEVDWLARRSKLQSGEAERPLLEFPAGQVQGSAACASCHKEIHAGWKNDPHGKAMDSLVKKGSDKDVGCVKCHSTLKDSKNPGNLASFEPGVGCESCHGPGEAHLKAGGGKGNIVALTKSCPVCIIESICTSCHTREQDPDFELEKALAAIKHPAH